MSPSPSLTELSSTDSATDPDPSVVSIADEESSGLFGALASATARRLLQCLHESPTYPSALADDVDTSVQNVHYHLDNLREAGAVEVVDTVYSEKGREMDVYAPTAGPLVVVAGDEDDHRDVVDALSELLGAVGVLALGSVATQWVVERLVYPGGPRVVAAGTGDYAAPPLTNVAPPVGLYVFVAGLAALLCWVGWRRWGAGPGA